MPELFAVPSVARDIRPDGSVRLASTEPLGPYPVSVAHWLRSWAAAGPDHPLVAERAAGPGPVTGRPWDVRSYGQVLAGANAIGQALLDRGLSAQRPLLVLSGNSSGHLMMALGAMTVGVPVAPVSVAYSLQSTDHARIRAIAALVRPGAIYAEDAAAFRPAIEAAGGESILIAARNGPSEHSLGTLLATTPTDAVERALAAIDGDSVAKILFTSGSTGAPKGVLVTHRMCCSNQQSIRQAWPFLTRMRPVLVDWLPWSHIFGGNHNVNMVLSNGGTLYIDEGRPAPALVAATLANYRDISPTMSFNVPAGYAQLAPALERDRALAAAFFARMKIIFNAAAALPPALRARLEKLAREVTGRDIPFTGSWGTTETAPAATSAHFGYTDARCIGVPLPGVELKLVPAGAGTYEIRVRGPLITPGYAGRPDLNEVAFDADGFYRPGDAVSFADPEDAARGLLFRGRLAEDFKLSTGTFVHVGAVRTALLSAIPMLSDAVITGEGRDEVCAMAWLNPAELRGLEASGDSGARPDDVSGTIQGGVPGEAPVLHNPALAAHLGPLLAAMNAGQGSASRVARLILLARPPSLDAGEITDKGYINQRQVLANRAELVDLLYTNPPPGPVIVASRW
jgi:feruloyl-CoA synthase